jgi:thiosulfate/3-mercaptopyruvate sulfurtransferase
MRDAADSPLVSVDWLASRLEDEHVRVVDTRWYLGNPTRGQEEYSRGHIPGAVFADVDRDLAAPPSEGPGRHPLPTPEAFAASLERLGIDRGSTVIAYDDAGGAIAARLWWLLRYFALNEARVLDGGIGAWKSAGLPLSTETPNVRPVARMTLEPRERVFVRKADVDRLRNDPSVALLDARAPERYEGKVEPIDARPGHIPGAKSAPFIGNLIEPGGRFLEREALQARYRSLGALEANTVIAYCGSGVTACHDLLALAILGREDALLYEGSWSDWARDPALPAALGSDPG